MERRLESWKEIAAYLNRTVRTVQRWEADGLPVRRRDGEKRSGVYAFPSEIDDWRRRREARSRVPRAFYVAAGVLAGVILLTVYRPRPDVRIERLWTAEQAPLLTNTPPGPGHVAFLDLVTGNIRLRNGRVIGGQRSMVEGVPGSAAFSPDGARLAADWSVEGKLRQLRIYPLDGGAPRLLLADPDIGFLQVFDWNPASNEIAVSLWRHSAGRDHRIAAVHAATGAIREIAAVGGARPTKVAFSPAGDRVAYDLPVTAMRVERDVFVDGAPVVAHPADDAFLDWTPDGRSLLFLSDRDGGPGIWLQPLAGGPPRLLRKDAGRIHSLGMAAGGDFYYGLETGGHDVYRRRSGAPPEPLLRRWSGTASYAAWSPGGRSLAYVHGGFSWNQGRRFSVIVIRDWESGEERQVRPRLRALPAMRWSPDGQHLAAAGWDERDRQGLFTIDAASGDVAFVAEHHHIRQGAWSPDGRWLYFLANRDAKEGIVARVASAGGPVTVLHRGPFLSGMDLSPDGTTLALCSAAGVFVLPAAGGALRQVSSLSAWEVHWARDGSRLWLARPAGPATRLWSADPETGAAVDENLEMGVVPQIRWSPDGKWLTFTRGRPAMEFWVMRGIFQSGAN